MPARAGIFFGYLRDLKNDEIPRTLGLSLEGNMKCQATSAIRITNTMVVTAKWGGGREA